ncbi:hypothetical protein SAMN05428988_0159 [Chitinophaga sp. YR573]|uniref:hypothetical protein n=1 Tax=Chitinophaga sp. YR573 TaxID=1881040 RepID=UPI0008BE2F06|nr:hypothetical protein [Chitinophaga sp. YR573]SEV88933.1 hypothetical protein SAMN05428988_0159 [Chitinophaga sp. YR573]
MQEKQVLFDTADTILDKAIRIDVDVLNPRWWERLGIKLRWLPAKRTFHIKPATLGNMIRISRLLLDIDVMPYKGDLTTLDANYQVLNKHGDALAEVIATAIVNTKSGPTKSMISFIKENLTSSELMDIAMVIVKQLNVVPFMTTIISIRGVSLLNPKEKIAFGGPSED